MFKIAWEHVNKPDVKGEGEPFDDYGVAQAWVRQANRDFPFLFHWIVGVKEKENQP